ncbi:hypothetical protein QFC19_003722 [Naganishia cerealis]|uniref:Uncharacterized protein n=1 Tax=Naganishia cerealis TaxID=610337 RepID=A0ACC2W2Q1_9TREE|nr:hypothetical protein QFC19_003722 [Naganishia cerealis]
MWDIDRRRIRCSSYASIERDYFLTRQRKQEVSQQEERNYCRKVENSTQRAIDTPRTSAEANGELSDPEVLPITVRYGRCGGATTGAISLLDFGVHPGPRLVIMSLVERKKGIQIHRAIVYGSHARLLTAAEKALAPDGHTHRWTVFLASAATPPPAHNASAGKGQARYEQEGLIQEDADFITGGADDLSWLIKRVTFRLHETYPQPNRGRSDWLMTGRTGTAIDRPPFAVTETGWGEFPLNIRVQFAPETGEKSVSFVHQLRLHHWGPVVHPPAHPPTAAMEETPSVMEEGSIMQTANGTPQPRELMSNAERTGSNGIDSQPGDSKDDADVTMTSARENGADSEGNLGNSGTKQDGQSAAQDVVPMEGISLTADASTVDNSAAQLANNQLSVNAWQYDELVFSDPTTTFYDLLISHPETPLPEKSLRQPAEGETGARWGMDRGSSGVPLEFTQEMARAETEKLERARRLIIDEMDQWRLKLIELEKEQQRLRDEISG